MIRDERMGSVLKRIRRAAKTLASVDADDPFATALEAELIEQAIDEIEKAIIELRVLEQRDGGERLS